MSLVLRHDPAKAGLTLDDGGWVDVDDLLSGLERLGTRISRERLEEIVTTNDKQRFTLSEDGTRIRGAQGHSVAVDLELDTKTPPDLLYHGTASRFLDAILREGLKPMSRHAVHLSSEYTTAIAVGSRHGTPVVLRVDAQQMHAAGHSFRQADNGVWLTERVPPTYLTRAND